MTNLTILRKRALVGNSPILGGRRTLDNRIRLCYDLSVDFRLYQ